jgi:hypothetical protein
MSCNVRRRSEVASSELYCHFREDDSCSPLKIMVHKTRGLPSSNNKKKNYNHLPMKAFTL